MATQSASMPFNPMFHSLYRSYIRQNEMLAESRNRYGTVNLQLEAIVQDKTQRTGTLPSIHEIFSFSSVRSIPPYNLQSFFNKSLVQRTDCPLKVKRSSKPPNYSSVLLGRASIHKPDFHRSCIERGNKCGLKDEKCCIFDGASTNNMLQGSREVSSRIPAIIDTSKPVASRPTANTSLPPLFQIPAEFSQHPPSLPKHRLHDSCAMQRPSWAHSEIT
jgi:hypothetical protein